MSPRKIIQTAEREAIKKGMSFIGGMSREVDDELIRRGYINRKLTWIDSENITSGPVRRTLNVEKDAKLGWVMISKYSPSPGKNRGLAFK